MFLHPEVKDLEVADSAGETFHVDIFRRYHGSAGRRRHGGIGSATKDRMMRAGGE